MIHSGINTRLIGVGALVIAGVLIILGTYELSLVLEQYSLYRSCVGDHHTNEPGSFGGPVCFEMDWRTEITDTVLFIGIGVSMLVFGYTRYVRGSGTRLDVPRSV